MGLGQIARGQFARSFFEGFIEDLFLLFIRSAVPRERSFKSFFFILGGLTKSRGTFRASFEPSRSTHPAVPTAAKHAQTAAKHAQLTVSPRFARRDAPAPVTTDTTRALANARRRAWRQHLSSQRRSRRGLPGDAPCRLRRVSPTSPVPTLGPGVHLTTRRLDECPTRSLSDCAVV